MKLAVALTLVLIACAVPVAAQVVNPSTLKFNPSADHDLVIDGVPVVDRYELRLYLEDATDPFTVYNLGKPTPIDGLVSITNPSWFSTAVVGTTCVVRVAAIGPLGEGLSDPSNTWSRASLLPSKGLVFIVVYFQ